MTEHHMHKMLNCCEICVWTKMKIVAQNFTHALSSFHSPLTTYGTCKITRAIMCRRRTNSLVAECLFSFPGITSLEIILWNVFSIELAHSHKFTITPKSRLPAKFMRPKISILFVHFVPLMPHPRGFEIHLKILRSRLLLSTPVFGEFAAIHKHTSSNYGLAV